MNIANQLTVLRIVLSFICMWFIVQDTFFSFSFGLLIFSVASFTDFLDGLFSRKLNMVSDFGKILDPIADKILMIGVFLAFLEIGVIHAWMVILIMIREFLITSLRIFALGKGKVLAAQRWGKHKTVYQIIGIIFIFLVKLVDKYAQTRGIFLVWFNRDFANLFIFLLMIWVVFITLFSGWVFLWSNRKIIRTL